MEREKTEPTEKAKETEEAQPTEKAQTYVRKSFHPLSPKKKKLILVGIFLVVLLGVGWFLNQQGILSKLTLTARQMWQEFLSLDSLVTPAVKPPTPTAQITVTTQGFVPQTILIKKGSVVKWTNRDNKPHQIASDPHPTHSILPAIGKGKLLPPGSSFTFTFDKAGTFTYHDEQNPLKFKGVVIVK